MHVLVVSTGEGGRAEEIAHALARVLAERGLLVDVARLGDQFDPLLYDAFVIGSDVEAAAWPESARRFVDRNARQLASRPTWMFSTGAAAVEPMMMKANAFAHGVLDNLVAARDWGASIAETLAWLADARKRRAA